MKEEKILINGLRVNYKVAGEGPALLVLHGWGGSSDSWVALQKIISEEGFKVIVPDFPGFGKSVTPPDVWSVGDYMDFILKFLEILQLDNFFLLGHSFGGRVAIKFATRYPEKLKSLILCDSAGIRGKPSAKARIIFLMAVIGNAVFSPKIMARFKDSARNVFYAFIRKRDYAKANGVMKETIKKVLGEDLLDDLSKIKTSTLIIWGENDKMVPVKYARVFREKIENAKLEIMPKVGHSPHIERPEKLAEIILKFLKQ